jgi:hypothetical protein
MTRSLLQIFVFVSALLLTSCGGGGGGGSSVASTCQTPTARTFYEVTDAGGCTNFSNNTLKTTTDIAGSGGFYDGGGGDLWIRRIAQLFENVVYAVLGIQPAIAQSISACGAGVEPSDLFKLNGTNWQYLPLVKSTVPDGTACVKRIFDANKYLAVYATGLSKFDKTCYLVLVNKANGATHCFSSSETLKLTDDVTRNSNVDYMTTSLFDAKSLSLSKNSKYLSSMFVNASGRILLARYTVDDDAALANYLVFDSSNLSNSSPWNVSGTTMAFQQQLVLNNGKAIVHLYRVDGSVNSSTQSGYTYLSDENSITAPTKINDNVYSNPQCVLQDPGVSQDGGFVGVFRSMNTTNYDLIKNNNGTSIVPIVQNVFTACMQSNSAAVTRRLNSDPAAGRLYVFAPTSANFGAYDIVVSYVDLTVNNVTPRTNIGGEAAQTAFTVAAPTSGTCGVTNSASLDLKEASLMLTADETQFIIAARTTTTFNSSGAITAGGVSTLAVYNSTHNLVSTPIPYNVNPSNCKTVRKFEKGSSGGFAYATEPYGQGTSTSLQQTTTFRDASFANPSDISMSVGQHFKLGATLKPL